MEKKQETRSFAGVEANGRTISGYAIVFNQKSEVLRENGRKFREVILPGAITEELLQRSDIKCYIDHDRGRLVARSNKGKGSLHLSIDAKGLRFSFSAPKTADGDFVVEMVSRGDLTGCSFAFRGAKETWREGRDDIWLREINYIAALDDVSIVQSPAYQQTSVGVRNIEKKSKKDMEKRNIKDVLPNWSDTFHSELSAKLLQDKVNVKVEKSARGGASYPFIRGTAPTIDRHPVQGAGDASIRVVSAEPKTIYSKIDLSLLARELSPGLYEGAIREVARQTAETINKWIVSPTQVVPVDGVRGVFVKEEGDTNIVPFAGEIPTWQEIVRLETLVTQALDDDGTALYVINPSMAEALKVTAKNAATFIMENNKINNHNVYVTSDVPDGFVGFGLFSNVVINEFDTLDIITDGITRIGENVTTIHCNYEADVAVLRDNAFVVGYTPTAHSLIFV